MRRALAAAVIVCAASCAARTPPPAAIRALPTDAVPARAEHVIDTLLERFDEGAAMDHVLFMSRFWRLAGNDGFDRSIDRLRERLLAGGFAEDRRENRLAAFDEPTVFVHAYPQSGHGWQHDEGTLAIVNADGTETEVLSKAQHRVALCINSFPTPPGGRVLRLVDVGAGRAADFEGLDLKDAVVLGDASPSVLWRRAMTSGAAGVVSTALPDYISPVPPGAPVPPRDEWDILQWSSVPYDAELKGFGFKASPRAAAELRRGLAAGQTQVRVSIRSEFTGREARMLIAEIPGASRPHERVVIAAHVQEPGANDNASGSATLTEMAVALRAALRDGTVARPQRTLTFLWIDEISGSRQWLSDFSREAEGVQWMFSLDMTGEDIAKTGGSFLVERWPDPGAIYDRDWDPHSEWGRGNVDPATLKGDVINDLHLAIARRVGARTGWDVRSNPYEGGSDHTVFGSRGIPSLLDWHFTDRYYHTNFDTPDKVSTAEMRNVAAAIGATAWLMASGTAEDAEQVAALVRAAGDARIAREEQETAADRDVAVAAWKTWYDEAVASAARLDTGGPAVATAGVFAGRATRQAITREAILLAEDRRAAGEGDHDLLMAAARHRDPQIRALAIRALGRLEQSHPAVEPRAAVMAAALSDADAGVRRTAAYALALAAAARPEPARAPRREALLATLAIEKDERVVAALMESVARLAGAGMPDVEPAILARATSAVTQEGATYALEVLARRMGNPGTLGAPAITWLRDRATDQRASPEVRRAAVLALTRSRAIDGPFAARLYEDTDWDVRRLAVLAAQGSAELPAVVDRARRDEDFHVRLEAVRAYAREIMKARGCAPVIAAVDDSNVHVALAAIDALAGCNEPAAAERLAPLATTPGDQWHRPSHALVTLARIDRARTKPLLSSHMTSAHWAVRMYAARAAALVQDDEALEQLAGDAHPNVREAAIAALRQRAAQDVAVGFPPSRNQERRERLTRVVRNALTERRDPQVLMTAAAAAAEAAEAQSLAPAMLEAIAALDEAGADTTIEARNALVDALHSIAPDMDAPPRPTRRPVETPTIDELRRLPRRARIEMASGGAFEIELLPDEAPATVARFARLARAGHYDGLTFHRVVPNFVVQGGSPWANEYSGAPRYQRDELGFARHTRGALGISTRGRDTGDAQIFIDLVDLPRLTHEYTVFGRVISGMDVVDTILEADVIARVTIVAN